MKQKAATRHNLDGDSLRLRARGDELRVERLSASDPAALLIVQDRSPSSPEQRAVVLFWRFRALAQFEIWYGRIYSKGKPDSSARSCNHLVVFFRPFPVVCRLSFPRLSNTARNLQSRCSEF